ncbi:UDP-N-acetylmuramoyl-L-alanine--D-glutamate ligase [Hellea balneolensis]|uniref:UDP-N-acetylmuramoyl-L-alanine--D-glutamate ligase n=1 Tax=Hellea balneolensis TaxID=287478 RepID=UPI000406A68A|nr:UDP-N-acetylmuramoyl-L-alanine--D-glutamate ligase [Hellea balneolensis]
MIKAATFQGQKTAVFGLGRTGNTAALSLARGGADVWAWDDNEAARKAAKAQGVNVKDLSKADWSDFNELVLSPGVPHELPKAHWTAAKAKTHGVPIICDIEIFAREVAARPEHQRPKIITITGTNGKSTTTALIGHILKACGKDAEIGGNIGRGVLDLDKMHAGKYYVLELSSYQLERTQSLRANAAVFLNLSPDHLERHGTMKAYEAAKLRIFDNQTHDDSAIIGVDNKETKRLFSELTAKNGRRIIPVSTKKSLGRGISVMKGRLYCNVSSKCVEVCDLTHAKALEGQHNHQNAAAAYAATQSLGLDPKAIGEAILSFPGLAHRMETIGSAGPVRFVNDSKATNADAAMQALKSYENIYWIAGGVAKAGGITPLEKHFPNISKAYLIGESSPEFHKTLTKKNVEHKISGTLEKAVLCATRDAMQSGIENPIILLSPACASFDQFKNFETRGEAFREHASRIIDLFEQEKNRMSAA